MGSRNTKQLVALTMAGILAAACEGGYVEDSGLFDEAAESELVGLSWEAEAGQISAPFAVGNGAVSQSAQTLVPSQGGRAAYTFTLAAAGTYTVKMVVEAPSDANNSLFFNVDSEPVAPAMIWDIPAAAGLQTRTATWRGSGSATAPQYAPKSFTLAAGTHTLIVRGREPKVRIDKVSLVALGPVCGDAKCEAGETCSACATDCGACVTAGNWYVAPAGNDANAGTSAAPFRTIQKAVSVAKAGEKVVVRGGSYNELVTFSGTGTASAYITFAVNAGETANITQGFKVTGSYNHLVGFTASPGKVQIAGSNNFVERLAHQGSTSGAALLVTGTYNTVKAIDFHHCGSVVLGAGSHNTISGGTIHHTVGILAVIDQGDFALLENLDMHDPGQVDPSGNASDGINLNANGVTIRGNRIYNIFRMNSTQHTDAIQWWNNANDLVIENNVLGSRARGGLSGDQDHGHIQFETYTGKSCHRVIIRNNLFLGTASAFFLRSSAVQVGLGQADGWQIVGNTFFDAKGLRGEVLAKMRNMRISNNIFTYAHILQLGAGSVYDYNAYLGVPVPGAEGAHSFTVADPKLTNPDMSAATAYGRTANLKPLATSPLVGRGVALASLAEDFVGKTRANPPTVGALEP